MKFALVKKTCVIVCFASIGLALAGCGRRGPPEPPPGADSNHAPAYLDEVTSGRMDSHNSTDANQNGAQQNQAQPGATPAVKKSKSFLLDPML